MNTANISHLPLLSGFIATFLLSATATAQVEEVEESSSDTPFTTTEAQSEDPERVLNALLTDDVDDSEQVDQLRQAASDWIDMEGIDALDLIGPVMKDSSTGQTVLSEILSDLVHQQPEAALRKGMQILGSQGSEVVLELVLASVKRNPSATLRALSSLDPTEIDGKLYNAVIEEWARIDAYGLIDHIDQLPDELRDVGRKAAILRIAKTAPRDAANLLPSIESGLEDTARGVVMSWASQDALEALMWAVDPANAKSFDLVPTRMYVFTMLAMSGMSIDEVELALREIAERSDVDPELRVERNLIARITWEDTARARGLLTTLSNSPARVESYAIVGAGLIEEDQLDAAFELANDLEPPQRDEYFKQLAAQWSTDDPEGMFEQIDRLPTDEAKSAGALEVTKFDLVLDVLSDEKIEHLQSYLTETDIGLLEEHKRFLENLRTGEAPNELDEE